MSEYYTHPTIPSWDSGAVHENSSIHNKVAFLLIHGGLYNERQIRALGLEKSWRLFYGILRNNRLNANSGFLAMRNAAVAEALSLAQQGIFTDKGKDNDLCQVRNAYAAVEIGQGDANCDGIEDEVVNGADDDHDGIFNQFDNCPAVWNPGQSYQPWTDQDNDKIGDACDQDRDGDGERHRETEKGPRERQERRHRIIDDSPAGQRGQHGNDDRIEIYVPVRADRQHSRFFRAIMATLDQKAFQTRMIPS